MGSTARSSQDNKGSGGGYAKPTLASLAKQKQRAPRASDQVLIREREIVKATIEEYEKELLELECKLKCKEKELHGLIGQKLKNLLQRERLKEKFESLESKPSAGEGYKLEDPFKIETWYFLKKEEAMLHIRFEKFLESCSFIKHDSTPATVIPYLENEPKLLEFKILPKELIKTGVQRRINRLKKLEEHEIIMKFFRDMIANDNIQKYWDCSSEELLSDLKAEDKFSYLDKLDDATFRVEFQRLCSLFPHSFKGDIEHMIRTLEQSLNEFFDLAYKEIMMSCQIVEKDVVYYDAFNELEKEFGKHWAGDSEGISSDNNSFVGFNSCDKQVGISKMVVMDDIEKPADMDGWFGSHKWTIKGDCVSQLTAAFSFQTRHGERLEKLPKSGFITRAQYVHKTKRQILRLQIDIVECQIIDYYQFSLRLKADIAITNRYRRV